MYAYVYNDLDLPEMNFIPSFPSYILCQTSVKGKKYTYKIYGLDVLFGNLSVVW